MKDNEQLQATLQRELETLERSCQELSLKMSLAKADIKSEWDRLQKRIELAREEIGRVHIQSKVEKIEQGTRELLAEIRKSYERIRAQL